MKRVLFTIFMIIGVLITLSVLLYPTISDYVNSLSQSQAVAHYVDDVAMLDDSKRLEMLNAARKYNEALLKNLNPFKFTEKDIEEYNSLLNTGNGVIGILAIDKINVKLPVYHGTDQSVLQIGIGHLQGTSLPVGGKGSHAVISGHRGLPSSKLLSDLDAIKEGDIFTLYIIGETLTYQVDQIKTVLPDEVGQLRAESDKDYCTVSTCTPYGVNTHRLLVRGHRIKTPPPEGWDVIYADARRLDKLGIILIFMVPVIPVLIIVFIILCIRIRRGGKAQRNL